MTTTWHALIAALLLLSFSTGCGDDQAHDPTGPARDSIIGYDLALAPLHYVDAAGRVFELLLAVGPDGSISAACYVVDGALFASIASGPAGPDADVQIYQGGRAVFRAVATAALLPPATEAWPAFAAASAETRDALAVWQRSASGVALARLHVALGRLASASGALVAATRVADD
jgi:hypothetical protein